MRAMNGGRAMSPSVNNPNIALTNSSRASKRTHTCSQHFNKPMGINRDSHRSINRNIKTQTFNDPLDIVAYAEWNVTGQSDYYRSGTITLTNLSELPINDPEISFVVDQGSFQNNYGFLTLSQTGNLYSGHLVPEKRVIQPGQSQTINFGINYPYGASINDVDLPHNFSINGNLVVIDDDEPPTTPDRLKLIYAGPTVASMKWIASFDASSGVKLYRVYVSDGKITREIVVKANGAMIEDLVPNTSYSVTVVAEDFAGNLSERSQPLTFTTGNVVTNPGNNSIMPRSMFVDATSWPIPTLGTDYPSVTGIANYYLGFIVAGPGGVTANWAGMPEVYDGKSGITYDGDATVSDFMKIEINELRNMGGDVSISFGGANGQLIEQTMFDVSNIIDIYLKIQRNYNVTKFDFDIEGAAITDADAIQRHIIAMLAVKDALPDLSISYTLPVDGSPGSLVGFNQSGEMLLQSLHRAGLYPDLVNGMAMEFSKPPNGNLYEACVQSINGMYSFMLQTFGDVWTGPEVLAHIGVCPMFGTNNNGDVFTLDNMGRLVDYATSAGIGAITGWDAVRDFIGKEKTKVDQNPGDYGRLIATFNPHSASRQFRISPNRAAIAGSRKVLSC